MTAERRQLTVLFCDLVGSTKYSVEYPLEDYLEIINKYKEICQRVEKKYKGHIARYIGDGVLFYFGYPYAQEDDVERATRAALSIINLISRNSIPISGTLVKLEVRIGIATGVVLVEDSSGSGLAVGEIPNLAARIQSLAQPNSVLVSNQTKEILGRTFRFTWVSDEVLPGFSEKQAIWSVEREAILPLRFLALRGNLQTPFFGRSKEQATLIRLFKESRDSHDIRIVEVVGEAGIGKSRLVNHFLNKVSKDAYVLVFNCSSHHTNSTLYPVIDQTLRAARIYPKDDLERKTKKITNFLAHSTSEPKSMLPWYLKLLGIDTNQDDMSSQEFRAIILESLVDRLQVLAKSYHVIILCEDIHWADPTTELLVASSFEKMSGLPVTMILTTRKRIFSSESDENKRHVSVSCIDLNKLSPNESIDMIQSIFGDLKLNPATLSMIEEKTDGIPLFIEDYSHLIKEKCSSKEDVAHELGLKSQIPISLQDALLERITKLGDGKKLVQVAAAIGRTSNVEIIENVLRLDRDTLNTLVLRLIKDNIFLEDELGENQIVTFRHALVQDAAYSTMLRDQKSDTHKKVAEAIQIHNPEEVTRHPEVLGYHYEMGGELELAFKWYVRSIEHALSDQAIAEAVELVGKATIIAEQLDVPTTLNSHFRDVKQVVLSQAGLN